jgi:hypothetical protein
LHLADQSQDPRWVRGALVQEIWCAGLSGEIGDEMSYEGSAGGCAVFFRQRLDRAFDDGPNMQR